jgi:predicted nucleotidyltransferase
MNRDELLAILRANEPSLRKQFFVRSLALFGSVARGQTGPRSDVDLLVEFDRPIGLLHLIGTAQQLEKLLGVAKVDLVLRRSVLAELRDQIFAEAIDVFAGKAVETPRAHHA